MYQGLNSRGFQKGEGPPPGSVKLNEGSLPVLVETTFWQIILPSSSCYLYYVIHLQLKSLVLGDFRGQHYRLVSMSYLRYLSTYTGNKKASN